MTAEQTPPDDPESEGFRVWMSFLFPDLAGWDNWLASLHNCGAKDELTKTRATLAEACRAREYDRAHELFKYMFVRRQMIKAKPLAEQGVSGRKQREKASASAADERGAEAELAHAMVRTLAAKVSSKIRQQGATATAREVRRLAANVGTDVGMRVAAYSERRLRDLISGR